jgi:hypothetical protein
MMVARRMQIQLRQVDEQLQLLAILQRQRLVQVLGPE